MNEVRHEMGDDLTGTGPNSPACVIHHDFARWAACVSQRFNRSLAGSTLRVHSEQEGELRMHAQEWGMSIDTRGHPADSRDAPAPEDGYATFDYDRDYSAYDDISRASAETMMDFAAKNMPVVRTLMRELRKESSFEGLRIAACLIIEPKTAVFLEELADAGARVGVYCDPDATNQRVAQKLRADGIIVAADVSWNASQCHEAALHLLDDLDPNLIIDDGASFARLASLERPDIARRLIGVAEETTSGVRAFTAMDLAHELAYPVIAVNDSQLKTGFDNAHGTGETCVTTALDILGDEAFEGKRVVIFGFGPVGSGFARRVRSLGADVTICDTDSVAALKAVFEGFPASTANDALPSADVVISATGVRHTITMDHMRRMKDGAVLGVIGGVANEIALDELDGFTLCPGRRIVTIELPRGPRLRLLSDGEGINYTSGGGNPIEIMDLSFAVQASAVAYLVRSAREAREGRSGPLPHRVLRLGREVDRRIAAMALQVRGHAASVDSQVGHYDWRLTRFVDGAKVNR